MKKVIFHSLRKQVSKAATESKKNFIQSLNTVINRGDDLAANWYFKELFTPAKLRAYKAGKLSPEDTKKYLLQRYTDKKVNKYTAQALNKIDTAIEQGAAVKIIVSLRWTKAYSGNVCHADVAAITANGARYNAEGHAGGYGYDKASTAAADAFDKLPPVLHLIYKLANGNKKIPYGASCKNSGLPYFDGGVGMECFDNVFKAAGLKNRLYQGTKTTDLYIYSK